jgi:LmbE family N-acetylglucosaminyl deacetylase
MPQHRPAVHAALPWLVVVDTDREDSARREILVRYALLQGQHGMLAPRMDEGQIEQRTNEKETRMADNPAPTDQTTPAPAPARAMTILAHPDDAEFGCGGTLATWARQGTEITMVIVTDGSKGNDDRSITSEQLVVMRKEEQDRAARILGAARVINLGYEDGVLQPTIGLRRDIARVIRQHKPDVIIVGDPDNRFGGDFYINHPDHRAAAEAALYGIFPAAGNFNFYPELLAEGLEPHEVKEVWVEAWGEGATFVDVTEAMDTKIAALAEHKSQFDIKDVEPFVRRWTEETGKKHAVGAAEAYRKITLQRPPDAEAVADAVEQGASELEETSTGTDG